jgi:hypothetical protein
LGLLTPAMVAYGHAENILRRRQEVLDVAYQRHPERATLPQWAQPHQGFGSMPMRSLTLIESAAYNLR